MAHDFTVISNCVHCGASFSLMNQTVEHKPDCPILAQINGEPLHEVFELTEDMEASADITFSGELARVINTFSKENDNNTPDFILAEFLEAVLLCYSNTVTKRGNWLQPVETNFAFYVDGYTMNSTDTIGEILATTPDGKTKIIPSSQLTAFLDRRMDN